MRKNTIYSMIIVFVLAFICVMVIILNPHQQESTTVSTGSHSSTSSSVITITQSSTVSNELDSVTESFIISALQVDTTPSESSLDTSFYTDTPSQQTDFSIIEQESDFEINLESDVVSHISLDTASNTISDLVSEDQPDTPNLNYETSGSSYDDIMVNVLTCLLTRDTASLSNYVGTTGLCLSPTGSAGSSDVVLSASQVASFFDQGTQTYGIYPGSGESIRLSAADYYDTYLVPVGFDFSTALVSYNDAADIAAASTMFVEPKTVSYEYSPNIMEWQRLILVYCSEGSGDVLCGIIYQDATTN